MTQEICCYCGLFFGDDEELVQHVAVKHCQQNDIDKLRQDLLGPCCQTVATKPGRLTNSICNQGTVLIPFDAMIIPLNNFIQNLTAKMHQQIIADSLQRNNGGVSSSSSTWSLSTAFGGSSPCGVANNSPSFGEKAVQTVEEGKEQGVLDMSIKRKMNSEEHKNEQQQQQLETKKTIAEGSDQELEKQEQQLQQPEKTHCCPFCGKAFRLKQTLLVHKRIHTGEKPYQCPMCPARFSHATNRKSHIRTHTKQRPFICDTCGRGFTRKFSLSLHRLRHVNSYPFKCDICDKHFRRGDIFRTHSLGHMEKFRFQCRQCLTRFSTKISLKMHQSKAHGPHD